MDGWWEAVGEGEVVANPLVLGDSRWDDGGRSVVVELVDDVETSKF